MEDVRPPIFKFIGFKKLTFGDVPFKIEGIHCLDTLPSGTGD